MASELGENLYKQKSFRDVLRAELAERKVRRKSYSIRAFARDLGINHNTLTGALRGNYGISADTARELATKLKYDKKERQFFVALVECEHSRTKFEKEKANRVLAKFLSKVEIKNVQPESMLLRKWFYSATLELLTIFGSEISVPQVSKALRITEEEAQEAFSVLIEIGILEEKSHKLSRQHKNIISKANHPAPMIRSFHKQLLAKAAAAIDEQPIENRGYNSCVLSFDKAKLPQAREWLRTMYKEFVEEFGNNKPSDAVYAFTACYFQVDNENAVRN